MAGVVTYDAVLTFGGTYTIPNDADIVHIKPASILAAATLIMPVAPNSEQVYRICIHQAITVLTWQLSPGQTGWTNQPPALLSAGAGFGLQWRSGTKLWDRVY